MNTRLRACPVGSPSALSLVTCAALAAMPGHSAHAQTVVAAAEVPIADAVIVTASRSQTRIEDVPLYTTVVGREQIETSPARSLDQLLRDIPGVNLGGAPYTVSDPTGQQMKIRGASNSKVLVLLDGVPVHDPFYGTIQWFKLPLSAIERVEIIRGGNSSLWGNMAVVGVVNIVSKVAKGDGGEVSFSAGSEKTRTASLAKNLQLGDAWSLRLNLDGFDTAGYNTTFPQYLATTPGKKASSDQVYNLGLAGYYTPNQDLKAYVRLGYHRQDQGIGGYTHGSNLQRSPDAAAGVTVTLADRSIVQASAWSQYVGFEKYNGAGCYLQANNTTCNTTTPTATLVQYYAQHDHNTYRELGASALYSTRLPFLKAGVQAGADLRQISGVDAADVWNTPTGPSIANSALNRRVFGQGSQRFLGVFGQVHLSPVERVEVAVSARVDNWSNTDGQARLTKASTGATSGGAVADSSKTSFNPSVSLRWDATDEWSLRGAAYKSFRAPGLNNLYRSFSSSTSITLANPNLRPETLTGGEVGLDFRGERGQISVTAFQMDVRNLVASYKIANVGVAPQAVLDICGSAAFGSAGSNCPATVNFNTNGQDGRAQGLEFDASWRVAEPVTIKAGFTRTRSFYTRVSTTDPIGVQIGGIPTNVTTLGLSVRPLPDLRVEAQVRYTGSMFLDIQRTVPQPGFAVLNLSANWQLQKNAALFASVTNLANETYSDSASTSASARSLSQPRVATLGARLTF